MDKKPLGHTQIRVYEILPRQGNKEDGPALTAREIADQLQITRSRAGSSLRRLSRREMAFVEGTAPDGAFTWVKGADAQTEETA